METGRVKGFTLVELIIVVVITVTLSAAIYTSFAQGVRLWTRAAKDRGEWKVDLWVEKLTGDLRNAIRDPQWSFKGTSQELSFAALIPGEHDSMAPSYFRYTFDPRAGQLLLGRYAFEEFLMPDLDPKRSERVLGRIVALDFEYYGYDAKARGYRWGSQWNKDCFPKTVKITIEPEQMNHRKWVRLIPLPTEIACPE